jgi:hypothetical protein
MQTRRMKLENTYIAARAMNKVLARLDRSIVGRSVTVARHLELRVGRLVLKL